MSLVRQAGLTPATQEFFTYHVHAHLDVFVNGRRVQIPGGIGIDITDPAVRRFVVEGAPGYSAKGCPQPCISPLHTHDVTGVLHIEAPVKTQPTLGQFFEEWGVRLGSHAPRYRTALRRPGWRQTSVSLSIRRVPGLGSPRGGSPRWPPSER